jgi:hypothetical protein
MASTELTQCPYDNHNLYCSFGNGELIDSLSDCHLLFFRLEGLLVTKHTTYHQL